MSFEETLRVIIREELRAALDTTDSTKWEGCLKLTDAAKLCGGLSVSTLEKWGRQGLQIHRRGRVRVVDIGELRAWLARRETTSQPAAKTRTEQLLAEVLHMRKVR